MSTATGTKSKLRETLKQEDAALAQRSRRARTPAVAAKVAVKAAAPAAVSVEVPVSAPAATDVIAPVLPPPKPAAARTPARPAAPKAASGAAAARATKVKPSPAPAEAGKAAEKFAEKPTEKPVDKAAEAERKDKHEKVERDSFSMPASEHKRIKALREALGKDGVLASKSEVLRAGLALLAERDIAELARLVAALPKVAKGKRARKH